jgi:hypothetical protein
MKVLEFGLAGFIQPRVPLVLRIVKQLADIHVPSTAITGIHGR